MNFDDFKKDLDTAARTENVELKKKVEKLEKENAKIPKMEHALAMLANRCYALSQGVFCAFCNFDRDICPRTLGAKEKERKATEIESQIEKELKEMEKQ